MNVTAADLNKLFECPPKNSAGDSISARGTVYGVVLNDKAELNALAEEFQHKPYLAAPKAPVMYIKTANTWATDGATVLLPTGCQHLKIDSTIGLVIGDVKQGKPTIHNIAGYVIASDVTIAHQSYYRPAISQRCRDGFLPMTSTLQASAKFDPTRARISTRINSVLVHERNLGELVRSISELLRDVSEFMTLQLGDILLVGLPHKAPLAKAGDVVKIEVEGLGKLTHSVASEAIE
jgi:5-oxopent-3-ene-1,2,5-tricarboxylate decarboxylase / 2-hydroxyhepta-2,4-diene-1,7-dioate isomerase